MVNGESNPICTFYPFGILSAHHLRQLDFEPITILYGGNGSGKSIALNIICEKLGLHGDTLYNRSNFYEDYLDAKYSRFTMKSLDDYETLKKVNLVRRKTQSEYIRRNLMGNVRAYYDFFMKHKEEFEI